MNAVALLIDHAARIVKATRGFGVVGASWLAPWFCYALSPVLSRLARGRVMDFGSFRVRLGEADLYTFANIFEDYDATRLAALLPGVEQVVDAGANVGAFSWLALKIGATRVISIEPAEANFAFLRSQPFASRLDARCAAIGPTDGVGRFCEGVNSVTHSIDFGASEGAAVQVLSLESLCDRPTLLKMDIEGGEWAVLQRPLPDSVRAMFLEWHPGANRPAEPCGLVERGRWQCLSRDLYGASSWLWAA